MTGKYAHQHRMLGTCEGNDAVRWPLQSSSLRRQLRHAVGPKRNPLRPWWTFTSRHCGPLWLSHFARPYVSAVWRALRPARAGYAGPESLP